MTGKALLFAMAVAGALYGDHRYNAGQAGHMLWSVARTTALVVTAETSRLAGLSR